MKKYLYCILVCICVISCNKGNQKSANQKPVYDYELVKTDKILSYELDDNTKYQFYALFPYTDNNGKDCLTFRNSFDEILFYDLESGKFLFKTIIEKEGQNGIFGVTGYYVEDFNNIYVTSIVLTRLTKIDTGGVVLQKIEYAKTANTGYQVSPNFVSISRVYTPLVIIDKNLYITQSPSPNFESPSKTPVSVMIDTLTRTFTSLPFYFPDKIQNIDFSDVSYIIDNYSRDFNGKEFIYSFYFDENIQVASIDHENIRNFPVKSRYINKIRIEKRRDMDPALMVKKDMETARYGNLIYDKYRDVYYRLAYPEDELENGLDYMFITHFGGKKFSIIILDNNFNIIGETLFPEFVYCSTILFVHRDGLYICNNHPENPSFNEDFLSFHCFELTQKKK
jgi:hypothetical protein